MVVNTTFYITKLENIDVVVQHIIPKLSAFNIKSLILLSKDLPTLPQFASFQSIESISQHYPYLIINNLSNIITDTEEEIPFNPTIFLIKLWNKTNEIFMNGKRYNYFKKIDDFVVDLFKERSNIPILGVYFDTNHRYVFNRESPVENQFIGQEQDIKPTLNIDPEVFLSWNFSDATVLKSKWLHLTERMNLTLDPNEAKYHVVVNASMYPMYKPDKIIYFCMEPYGDTKLYAPYVRMIKDQCLFLGTHERHLNNAEWHLTPSLHQLKQQLVDPAKQVNKTAGNKALSVVVSDKAADPGHKYRLALIKALDEMSLEERGFSIDIYGKCQSLKFKNYKGELPEQNKDQALFPYKYHLNVENHYIKNYITEKLIDGICGECITFYKGAPNWSLFFSKDSVVELSGEISSIPQDIKMIQTTIQSQDYDIRKENIIKDKIKVLYQYSFEPRLYGILQTVKAKCVVSSPILESHYKAEGFKQVKTSGFPVNIVQNVQESLQTDSILILQTSSKIYPNLFDIISFYIAQFTTPSSSILINDENSIISKQKVHGLILSQITNNSIDMVLFPSGCEQIQQNIKKSRNIFENLKCINVTQYDDNKLLI